MLICEDVSIDKVIWNTYLILNLPTVFGMLNGFYILFKVLQIANIGIDFRWTMRL